MKYFSLIFLTLSLFLSACSDEPEQKDATIKEADLTDYEEQLTDIVGQDSYVYDVELGNDNINEIHAKVDYYKNGHLEEEMTGLGMHLEEEDPMGTFRVAFLSQQLASESQDEYSGQQWIVGILSENGYSSTKAIDPVYGDVAEVTGTLSSSTVQPETSLQKGEEKVVAATIYTDDNAIRTPDFDSLDNLSRYDDAYIMSIALK